MGGSLGLAIRRLGLARCVVGVARTPSTLQSALAMGAVDETTHDLAKAVAASDLVVLATPVGTFGAMLRAIARHARPGTIVTDVGSTKGRVVTLAHRILPENVPFVGAHPMAGSENAGVQFARDDLFEGATVILTPTAKTDPDALQAVAALWRRIASRVVTVSPKRHDRMLARASHLPHALAACLVPAAASQDALSVAGTGFQDTSRIASGDPDLWRDVFLTNRSATVEAVDAFIERLTELRDAIQRRDGAAVRSILAESKTLRDAWLAEKLARREIEG